MREVRQLFLSCLLCLGLFAGALHAPAMALPPEPAVMAMDDLHADCHGAAEESGKASDPLGCCPDGCRGGCLLAGALFVLPAIEAPLSLPRAFPPVRAAQAAPDPGGGAFHPPRTLA